MMCDIVMIATGACFYSTAALRKYGVIAGDLHCFIVTAGSKVVPADSWSIDLWMRLG